MIDYKKKILKYKTKYLKLIQEKKKFYGGTIYPEEISAESFVELLIHNSDYLETHAEYYMFERDIAHDFNEVNALGFTKYFPYGWVEENLDNPPDVQYKIKNSNEHFHTLKYILNNNLDVFLYSIPKNIKYKEPPYAGDETSCILNYSPSSDCPALGLPNKLFEMPFQYIKEHLPYLYYDSGSTGHFSKFNLSWTNLFDPSTTANTLSNLPPEDSLYSMHKDDKEELIRFLNHKWQQTLIFSWYSKTGTKKTDPVELDIKASISQLWPDDYDKIDSANYLSAKLLNSTDITESNLNYKRLYIAINILRLLHITFDEKLYQEKHLLVAQFKFSSDIKSPYYNSINEIIQEYNTKFINPLLCIIKQSDVLSNDTDLYNLPISAADTFLAFISKTDWPGKKARGNKKQNSETIKMSNELIPIITNICKKSPNLNFKAKDIKRVILYIGVLLKYAIGDTTFILAQLYDKFIPRGEQYLRSFDNFLNMRNLMFKNNIIGEANKNKLFKFYSYQLEPTGADLDNHLQNNNIFYSVKFSLTSGEFIKEINSIEQYILSQPDWYGTYSVFAELNWKNKDEFWGIELQDGKKQTSDIKNFLEKLEPKPDDDDHNKEFVMSDKDKNEYKNIKKKFLDFSEIYNIFTTISSEIPNNNLIITQVDSMDPSIQSEVSESDFGEKTMILFKNFIHSLLQLYDDRINDDPPIKIYTTDFKIGKGYPYNSPLMNLPMTETNIDILSEYNLLFDKIINYLNLFAAIKKYTNLTEPHEPVVIVENYINKFLECNFMNKTHNKNISGYRNLGKYTKTLLAGTEPDNYVNIKDFLNVLNIRIFDNVRKQHLVGWYQFENVSSIFDNFYETYNKFLKDYSISDTNLQIGGSSIYEEYDYIPTPVIKHRIEPLLNKNEKLQNLIINALKKIDSNINFNLIDITIIFIIELLSDNTFFQDKTENQFIFPNDDGDILEADKLIRLRDFLNDFNDFKKTKKTHCWEDISIDDYNKIEEDLEQNSDSIFDYVMINVYNSTKEDEFDNELNFMYDNYITEKEDINKINVYKKIIIKIINNNMEQNIYPRIRQKIDLFRDNNFRYKEDTQTFKAPLNNLSLNLKTKLQRKLRTCKSHRGNDCTKNILLENKQLNSNFEFYIMTDYLSEYLFITDIKAGKNNQENNNFYNKNLRTFNLYFKLYYGFFNYLNTNKENEKETDKKLISEYGIIDIYNTFVTSLNSFITDIINLMYNDTFFDIYISWINNLDNYIIGETIKNDILQNEEFYKDKGKISDKITSETNVIQELIINHDNIILLINAMENKNNDEIDRIINEISLKDNI